MSRFIRQGGSGRGREPAATNVDEVAEPGRALVSFGLLANLVVNEHAEVGDLALRGQRGVTAVVNVLGPAWVQADRVELFANGVRVAEQKLLPVRGTTKARVAFKLPRLKHDVHLVAMASGPGVTAPFWETPRPYQPSSKTFTPRVLGATNPVWVDGDGDGKFTAARHAEQLVKRRHDAAKLFPAPAHSRSRHGANRSLYAAGRTWSVEFARDARCCPSRAHGWVS